MRFGVRVISIDIQKYFFFALGVSIFSFAAACALRAFIRKRTAKRREMSRFADSALAIAFDAVFYALSMLVLVLVFGACYVFFVKNGYRPDAGDMGVAFVFVATSVFWLLSRAGVFDGGRFAAFSAPALYSAFLVFRWAACAGKLESESSLVFMQYFLVNPIFGFIGSRLTSSTYFPLHSITALLPFVCFVLGYELANRRAG